jgi:hypothetical protein
VGGRVGGRVCLATAPEESVCGVAVHVRAPKEECDDHERLHEGPDTHGGGWGGCKNGRGRVYATEVWRGKM